MSGVESCTRPCFLCGAREGPAILRERWPVTGLGVLELGFRVCGACGAVRQDPAPAAATMTRLYRTLSNYTNPGRDGRPGARKVRAVERQLAHLHAVHPAPGAAFQVGSSDGYTLSELRRAGWRVQGLDPSPAAARVAKRLWGVDTHPCAFEDWEPRDDERWDCVVLTHVLEHLYDPVAALARAFAMLAPGGLVLVEVPCLVRPETWPPGFFTLEHVNYFSAEVLAATIARAGGALSSGPEVEVGGDLYPVVRCTARPAAHPTPPALPSPQAVWERVDVHRRRDLEAWARVDTRLDQALADGSPVVVYGAGIHTSQLFARTGLGTSGRVRAILDSDPQKWGVRFDRWRVAGPEYIAGGHAADCAVVISSFHAEREIRAALEHRAGRMRRLVTLYD